ncbi:MAG: flavin oxidoreductase [Microvirga sp.]|jgi:flavin reductase (DIM6/NTAB) family NADH-FMN oxidoreductase RutF/DNA-binding MarR family transcriptional regulator|nr:flavin oxidoreductase [Microvirga sp.]
MNGQHDLQLLDAGDPAGDPRAFRRALGQFATGVTVITAMAGDEPVAVTANSFSSVSLDPPMVLWSLRRESRNLPAFQQAEHFAINVLAADQMELSNRFSRSAGDRFGTCDWRVGLGGAPIFDGVAAQFECRRVAEHDGGDHVIFIGKVERYSCFDRAGLLFSQGRYALALDHPGAPADLPIEAAAHPRDDFFLPLLVRAYTYLSDAFKEHHDAEEVTTNQSRVLAFLATRSGASAEVIARLTFLGVSAVEDALARLVGMGLVAPRPPGAIAITQEGIERLRRITMRAHAFEEEHLAGLDPDDVAATRRVLLALASRDGS